MAPGTTIPTAISHSKALDDRGNWELPQLCTDAWAALAYGVWAVSTAGCCTGVSSLQIRQRDKAGIKLERQVVSAERWWNFYRKSGAASGRLVFSLPGVQTLKNIKSLVSQSWGNMFVQLPPEFFTYRTPLLSIFFKVSSWSTTKDCVKRDLALKPLDKSHSNHADSSVTYLALSLPQREMP